MSRYDLTDAMEFLEYEADMTPSQLKDEIEDAMSEISPKTALWHTLLTVADMLERIA